MLPYISEEAWSWAFAKETGHTSIHIAPWPEVSEFDEIPAPQHANSFDLAVAALAAINKCKADAEVSMGREVERLTLRGNAATLDALKLVLADVLQNLKVKMGSRSTLFKTLAGAVGAALSTPAGAGPYLARMGLEHPGDLKEAAVQKLIVAELRDGGYI